MSEVIKIKRGLNIRIKGKAEKIFVRPGPSETYAVKPIDFHGITPKLSVKPEDKVKAGSPLFFDKYEPDVLFTSPVSGQVIAINRGERRRIHEVVVKPDKEIEYEVFEKADPVTLTADQVKSKILKSGCWPYIKQLPYSIIANPNTAPKSIFISAFDTAPLAPDYDFIAMGAENDFQTGVNALRKLTKGKIYLNVNADYPPANAFTQAKNVTLTKFKGPHPTGNPGVQIHHLDPVNRGEVVWYVRPQEVIIIGRLFNKGIYDASKIVALTGSEVLKPKYYKIISGSSIKELVENNVTDGELRYISGNILTGKKIPFDGFIGFYDSQVTVIPEGKHHEFMGWAMPGFNKYSMSRTFWSWLMPDKEYRMNTNLHGGPRAFVVTGQYEKVLPLDIYPMQLLKSILVEDIDQMEKLGIYEVAEEDFALCEFVCTSKTEVQSILRRGLDMMKKEMG